jgi:hypothetical protein
MLSFVYVPPSPMGTDFSEIASKMSRFSFHTFFRLSRRISTPGWFLIICLIFNGICLVRFIKRKLPFYLKRVRVEKYTLVVCNRQNVRFSRMSYIWCLYVSSLSVLIAMALLSLDILKLIPLHFCFPFAKIWFIFAVVMPLSYCQIIYSYRLATYIRTSNKDRTDLKLAISGECKICELSCLLRRNFRKCN